MCAFLFVKIVDRIIYGLNDNFLNIVILVLFIEEFIWFLFGYVNFKRDMVSYYDVMEVYIILLNEVLFNFEYDFYEELSFDDCVYSFDGRTKLYEKFCFFGYIDFIVVYFIVLYVMVIGCIGGRAFLVDIYIGFLLVGRYNVD